MGGRRAAVTSMSSVVQVSAENFHLPRIWVRVGVGVRARARARVRARARARVRYSRWRTRAA